MYFDADKNDHGLRYNPIKALTVPRPIGWISTISRGGVGNLAPFSYFNALSHNPPFVLFSGGSRPDGSKKDSVINAEETGEFVFNIATYDTRDKMNDSSWIEDPSIDELAEVGLTPLPSVQVKPPRVAESPACRCAGAAARGSTPPWCGRASGAVPRRRRRLASSSARTRWAWCPSRRRTP